MSDGLDPSGPAQPSLNQAYTTPGNPAEHDPSESGQAARNAQASSNAQKTDQRIPQEQSSSVSDATPSSLGRGVHGAGAGEEKHGKTQEDVGRHQELDGQQLAAPGEGDVADAVKGGTGKTGASGGEKGLETDLARKKAEQAPLREAKKAERAQDVDVAGALGQTGGPANPVDKNNYPNTGSS